MPSTGDETSPLLSGVPPALATDPEQGNGSPTASANGTSEPATSPTKPRLIVVFPAISIGTFLASADSTIALVSYATIASELDALNQAAWIMTAYSLTLASSQPLYGKLCDIFGRKQCLLAAYVLFAAGCLLCATAASMKQLIAARVVQAVGGAGLSTVVSILITGLVPAADRGIWQGILNLVYSLGAGLGAPLGGTLAGTVGWRWSFAIQVPACVLATFIVAIYLGEEAEAGAHASDRESDGEEEEEEEGVGEDASPPVPAVSPPPSPPSPSGLATKLARIDFAGAASLVVAISALMLGLDHGSNVSWAAPETAVAFAVFVLATGAFVHVESRVAREPVVPLSVTLSPDLLPLYLSSFLVFFGLVAMDFCVPLYYQVRGQLTPQEAALYMLPAIAFGTVSALSAGFYVRRSGQYYWAMVVGGALQTAGCLIAYLVTGAAVEYMPGLILAQVVAELGIGAFIVASLVAVIANANNNSVAVVTAAYYAFRSLGAVLGVSVVSSVFQQILRRTLRAELQRSGLDMGMDVDVLVDEVRRSIDYLQDLDPNISIIVRACYGRAMNKGFLLISLFSLAGAIQAAMARRREIKK